ncbi:MAG: NAD-dependent epimerase/dehydratase family protein [Pseudomonadota bacterium]
MSDSILVTGAAGFIGFSVAKKLLEAGESVFGIDNLNDYYDVTLKENRLEILKSYDGFDFQKIDISDIGGMKKMWVEKGPFKRVLHLAAQAGVRYSLTNPHAYIKSNSMGHTVVMDLCRHTGHFEHMVYASSSSVYGANTKLPFSVKDPVTQPMSMYAATKRGVELLSESYARLYSMAQTGLRFFTVYGPWGRPDMALFIFTKAILQGEPLPVFNGGEMKRDFTYIDDIVDGIIAALNNRPTEEIPHRLFNLGNTRSEELMDFIKIIESTTGKKAEIDFHGMQLGDVPKTYADITESRELLDYNPKTTIEEGIPKFIQWYQEYYRI